MTDKDRSRFFIGALIVVFIISVNLFLNKNSNRWEHEDVDVDPISHNHSTEGLGEEQYVQKAAKWRSEKVPYCNERSVGQPNQVRKSYSINQKRGAFSIERTHDFEIEGRVLSMSPSLPQNDGRIAGLSELIPMNALIGIGPFNIDKVHKNFNIWHMGRSYRYQFGDAFELPQCAIVWNIVLLSFIFEGEYLQDQAFQLRVGDTVKVTGDLVNLSYDNEPHWIWNSSLTRGDEGDGSSEILYVKSIEKLN